jgi:DNA repair exonuclease SbcCD ATPase subunit
MSNASSIGNLTSYQAPTFSEASGVMEEIKSQVGNVNDLFSAVQQILAELQALQPPDANSFKDSKGQPDTAAFTAAMSKFQGQLNDLNQKLEHTYRKLGQAQALLSKIQSSKLPAAQRRDAEKMEKAAKNALEKLNNAANAIDDARKASEEGSSASQAETKIEIRVRDKKIELRLDKYPDFKDVIHAFALMAMVVGQGKPGHKLTHVPPAAGGGLPPIGTL